MKSKVWTLNNYPVGLPLIRDFTLAVEDVEPCSNDGDVIIEAECFSVDPYMRKAMLRRDLGETIYGGQVARVIQSRNKKYPVGTYIVGYAGWREKTHLTESQLEENTFLGPYYEIPETGKHPKSTALGIIGMPGATAYFGVMKVLDPNPGDVLLVNGAAGAVGSIVCQMGKILGCTVIAFVGSEKKLDILKHYGIDHVFNYKTVNISETLKNIAPAGINCYFDNVGGEFTAEAVQHLAPESRVAVCGSISTYNEKNGHKSLSNGYNMSSEILMRNRAKVQGFLCAKWFKEWPKAFRMLKQWMDSGRIKYYETTTKGFTKLPEAFIGLFHGDNIGKAIVNV